MTIKLSSTHEKTLYHHWLYTGELTVTKTRELLPDCEKDTQRAAFLSVQKFIDNLPVARPITLIPPGSLAEAKAVIAAIESPKDIDPAFEYLGNLELQRAAYADLPPEDKQRLRPIFAEWKRGKS